MIVLLGIVLFVLLLFTLHGHIGWAIGTILSFVVAGIVAAVIKTFSDIKKHPMPPMMDGETAQQYIDRMYRTHNQKNPMALKREQDFQMMNWQDFERAVEAYFNRLGWATVHTGKTGDLGVDVLAYHPTRRLQAVIQCKHYTQNVGSEDVQKLAGAMMAHNVACGYLVTNADFTQQAREFASMCMGLELINGETLAETWEGAI